MNSEPKKTNETPGSNYCEETPKGKVPEGDKAVKQPEDEIITKRKLALRILQKNERRKNNPLIQSKLLLQIRHFSLANLSYLQLF